ncbi:hypothetical protein [Metamycoplasma hominis]|uniref:hypothetical protein n=2 Tax=Metamycoplasma hominis TaxID=2098 RepID=UPI00193A6571|nr:hypothetical protein [Metamycoplasma hominis]
MDEKVIDKYKIHFINDKRYYEFDMTNLLPSLDETIPYYFKYDDIEIYSNSWNRMTLSILSALDNKNHKSNDELLMIHYFWTKTDIFSSEKRTNYTPFRDLYLNTNHTSAHAMMNIQGLLKAYNIPLEKCYFLIRRHISAEPEEVKKGIRADTIFAFSRSLQLKGYSSDRIGVIVSNFRTINEILSKVSPGYNDFFLFDDYYYFTNYKAKLVEWLEKRHYSEQDKTYRAVKRCLDLLGDFYKNKNFYNDLSNTIITNETIKFLGDEIENLFLSLNTDVIVSNKLYARMRMVHYELLKSINQLNNPKSIYKLASIYFGKKYYFKEPFISRDKSANLSNDEIIYSYAYTMDEISILKLNQYADKMQLKKLDNYLLLFEDASDEYIQIDESKLIKKDKIDIAPAVLDKIEKELLYYLDSFGSIDSETYAGYNSMPSLNVSWNKYLLLGLCRTYFNELISIKYNRKQYKKITFKLELKQK